MSKRVYLMYLEGRLTSLQNRVQDVKQRLERANPMDRVHMAGELAVLERRIHDVTAKIGRVKGWTDGLYAGIRSELEEDVDSIGIALDEFFSGVR